jgi:hypothetical protein
MSDTPETDLEDDLFVDCDDSCASLWIIKASTGEEFTGDFVPAEFARRLERERDQLRAINAELLEALDFMYNGSPEKDQTERLAQVRQSLVKAKEAQP